MEHTTTETTGAAQSDAVAGLITAFDAVTLAEIIMSDGKSELTRNAQVVMCNNMHEMGRKLKDMIAYACQAKGLQDRGRASGLEV